MRSHARRPNFASYHARAELALIEPAGDLLLAHLRHADRIERIHARKIVLATGFDGSGSWRAPRSLVANLPAKRYAHSADDIDFRRLAGKRVGVLGVGASAFDNAATALEAGAARVDLCFRRSDIPRVNPLIWMNFAGMFGHFGELSDLERWPHGDRFATKQALRQSKPTLAPSHLTS